MVHFLKCENSLNENIFFLYSRYLINLLIFVKQQISEVIKELIYFRLDVFKISNIYQHVSEIRKIDK